MDDDAVLLESSLQQLEEAITHLNEAPPTCSRLFYLDRHPDHRCAERTGFSTAQVRSHLQNGRRNLKLLLERMRKTG